jgi:hypothetical protein
MWQQYEMVTDVLMAERKARIDRAERRRPAPVETATGSAKESFRAALLLVLLAILAMAGRMILI